MNEESLSCTVVAACYALVSPKERSLFGYWRKVLTINIKMINYLWLITHFTPEGIHVCSQHLPGSHLISRHT